MSNESFTLYNPSNLSKTITPGSTAKPRFLDSFAKRCVLERLSGISEGELILVDKHDSHIFGSVTTLCPVSATINVTDDRFYSDLAFGGSIGAGEAYMSGFWQASNLTSVVRIIVCNRQVLDVLDTGLSRLTAPMQKVLHWLNRNNLKGSRRNIAAHYDLGNDLFKIMLDDTLMYSSAIFLQENTSLYDAQIFRLHTICRKLDLKPTDHLLEIGSGWGGLSIHAASHHGCRVTTTTISQEQYELACQRVQQAGLSDKITVLLEDYRDLNGQYDKLVSVEMIEAVGHQYHETYFRKCSQLLKPEGQMLLQAITIADQQYEQAKHAVDFIQRYIFPGSCIPSITAMLASVTRASDMRLIELTDIGIHYAETLHRWHENIIARSAELKALGYDETFQRMWEFYLCYCEGGFRERAISDVHMLLVKPGYRIQA